MRESEKKKAIIELSRVSQAVQNLVRTIRGIITILQVGTAIVIALGIIAIAFMLIG